MTEPVADRPETVEALVEFDREGDVVNLSMMYRPYNLIGPKLLGALSTSFQKAVTDGARAIVVRSGLRHFSAGADMDQFTARIDPDQKPKPKQDSHPTKRAKNPVVDFLAEMELLPVPIIASVHGVCLGGGLELALACDYIIAAQSAKIGSVEATLGLHPLMGATQRQVQRIGVARAKEMSMLARRYDATTMRDWGLINHCVADDELEAATTTIAQELAHGPTVSYAATKKLAYIAANQGVRAADEAMAEIQKPIWRSEDLKAGLSSFMRNGPGLAKFQGK
jgi:enoyl-CoA hydratase/carnithine racemase